MVDIAVAVAAVKRSSTLLSLLMSVNSPWMHNPLVLVHHCNATSGTEEVALGRTPGAHSIVQAEVLTDGNI